MAKHSCGSLLKQGAKGLWCAWCWANEEVHRIQEGQGTDEDYRNQHARESEED
jgi:hypothetical protein